MRTWVCADALTLCGGICQGQIRPGEPMQKIALPGAGNSKVKRVRCRHCADEPVPVDIPESIKAGIEPSPLVRAGVVKLPFDFKAAQAGRDPGEDDE